MSLEEEMRNEMYKLEEEIREIDEEMQKISTKIVNLINIKKKKEHDLKVLRENFGLIKTEETELQTSLRELMRENL